MFSRAIVISLAVLVISLPLAAQFPGAIWTTDQYGNSVDGNVYENAADVYLSGGPKSGGGGLPDGAYYFQVMDPTGAVLLSTEPASCRQATVVSGSIMGWAPTGDTTLCVTRTGSRIRLSPFDPTPNQGHEYKVFLIRQGCSGVGLSGQQVTFPSNSAKSDNFKVKTGGGPPQELDYRIGGVKYYDGETNGYREMSEALIPGWRIDVFVNGSSTAISTFTGTDGVWALVFSPGTTYKACEVLPATGNYFQTGPLPGLSGPPTSDVARCFVGTVGSANVTNLDFGNVCLGPGGGKTLGFWSNKNGQVLVTSDKLATLRSLNLRNADGSNFDPVLYADLRTWLLNATATNMAYMLSAQLAAMQLNVLSGFVSGSALIYAPGTTSANANGFATVTAIITEANATLGTNGLTLAGNPERTHQEALKNALDNANNNRTFVQPGACPFTY